MKPRTRLTKFLAKIAGVYDGELNPKTETEYYLDQIAVSNSGGGMKIPEITESDIGKVLGVVESHYHDDLVIIPKQTVNLGNPKVSGLGNHVETVYYAELTNWDRDAAMSLEELSTVDVIVNGCDVSCTVAQANPIRNEILIQGVYHEDFQIGIGNIELLPEGEGSTFDGNGLFFIPTAPEWENVRQIEIEFVIPEAVDKIRLELGWVYPEDEESVK